MKKIKENLDKGSSFTKMTKDQYLKSGEKDLQNEKFYRGIENDQSTDLKEMRDNTVDETWLNEEISESVAKYLKSGDKKLPKFHHLIKCKKFLKMGKTLLSGWRVMVIH